MRRLLRRLIAGHVPPGYDVDTHFNPSYEPWDQRMCFVPDHDLFEAISDGSASVVTDRIEAFTESWTLGSDLTSEHVCRLLNHMDERGYDVCTPRRTEPAAAARPFAELASGYVLRSIDRFPRQGAGDPWRRQQHYPRDRRSVRRASLDGPALEFSRARPRVEATIS